MGRIKDRVPLEMRVRIQRGYLYAHWIRARYPAPAPQAVKLGVLARYGYQSGTWVESGTYLGDTTKVLARSAERVITIEPSPELAARAQRRLARFANIEVREGLSQNVLPALVAELSGTASFWLDGHSSGGITHADSGVTPIREELSAIGDNLERFDRVTVFVDDFRGFGDRLNADGAYPPRSALVAWADQHNLSWTVEHDIFVAWR